MTIEWVEIDKLKPNPKNPNKHSPEQIARLIQIIKYQGWRHPIIVEEGTNLIHAGHGRWMAAKEMGLQKVPVHFQTFDNPEQAYAFLVSDNAIASWADLDLSEINRDILELGPDFDIEILGIKDFVLDLNEENPNHPDETPEVKEGPSICQPGDLFLLGEHRLLCGDSTKREDVERLMNGENADMVFTDPPYGMDVVKPDGNIGGARTGSIVGASKMHKAKVGVYRPIIGDDKPFDPTFLLSLCDLQIIWGANHFSDKLPASPHWIVWNKEMPEGTDFSGAELAWTNINKKAVKVYKFVWAGMTRQGDRKEELTKRVHPTQKPVGLFTRILNDYNPKSVIDLFLGSGSTLIACHKTNRKCYACEIDPHYVDVAIKRWEKFSGEKAYRLNKENGSKTAFTEIVPEERG